MRMIEFDEDESVFLLTKDNIRTPYRYYPDSKNVWTGLKNEDFIIVVLNNPFLHRETDTFEVKFDESESRGGFLFPIALLESEEVRGKQLLSYMLVAYRTLLLQIEGEATGVLSESYKDAFVLAIHKATVPNFMLNDYLLSLSSYGFYLYQGEVNVVFPSIQFINTHPKILNLKKSEKNNLSIGYVKDLVEKRLCTTSDFLTRFVLVYQVVELYISKIHSNILDDAIDKYKKKELSRNDFGEELKNISRESYQISRLTNGLEDEAESIAYRREITGLFNDVGYKYRRESLDILLYALRNQIFHNYEMFVGHEDTLNQIIFCFERLILMVLSKKQILGC